MFTGIVQYIVKVRDVMKKGESIFVTFEKPESLTLHEGGSITVNGVCSTVRHFDDASFEVEYMAETLTKTTAGELTKDGIVNLEPSLKLGDEMGGHIVQGHVDGIGEITEIAVSNMTWQMTVAAPKSVMEYVVHKGSVALDGISLTVASCYETSFTVAIIAHTRDNTTLIEKKVGDHINIEVDVTGKYIKKFLHNEKDK